MVTVPTNQLFFQKQVCLETLPTSEQYDMTCDELDICYVP
jgi:hypothetical protein